MLTPRMNFSMEKINVIVSSLPFQLMYSIELEVVVHCVGLALHQVDVSGVEFREPLLQLFNPRVFER